MPPKHVQTIRHLIYWQCAELIAKAAALERNYGFITSRCKRLLSGEMKWSSSLRDHIKELEKGNVCAYCGATGRLSADHIIPILRAGVDPRVTRLLDSADNCVCACRKCNSSKGDKDAFEWFGKERVGDPQAGPLQVPQAGLRHPRDPGDSRPEGPQHGRRARYLRPGGGDHAFGREDGGEGEGGGFFLQVKGMVEGIARSQLECARITRGASASIRTLSKRAWGDRMESSAHLLPVDDGLQMRDSGRWVAQKLDYLGRYIGAFGKAMHRKFPHRAYLDLFCGPGKCRDRDSGEIYLGSPLVALTTAFPFTQYYFVDSDTAAVDALRQRCAHSPLSGQVECRVGDANTVAASLVSGLQARPSLNLAFLDPEGLELAWDTVAVLARLPRVDLIIHYPQMGLNRYMPAALTQPGPTDIDRFFGGDEWRPIYEKHRRGEESFLHRQLIDHYKSNLAHLGYLQTLSEDEAGLEPPMVNENGVPLYRLLFASKHPLGRSFWSKITSRDVHGQRRLPWTG